MTMARSIQNAQNEVEKAKDHINQASKILASLSKAELVQMLDPSKNNFQAHVNRMHDAASTLGQDLKQCDEQLGQMVDTQKARQEKDARDAVWCARVVYGLDTVTEVMVKQNNLRLRRTKAKENRLTVAETNNKK